MNAATNAASDAATDAASDAASNAPAPERFSLEVAPDPGRSGAGPTRLAAAAVAAYRWPPLAAQSTRAAVADGGPTSAPDPRGRPLVIVHGFAEHARRHAELARAASAAGHDVWAVDLPGHGESPGARAVVAGYERSLEVVGALIERAREAAAAGLAAGAGQDAAGRGSAAAVGQAVTGHVSASAPDGTDPAAPVLFGHSMGGAIALRYALAHPERLAGLVLSSPFLLDAVRRPAWLTSLSGLVAALAPRLPVAKLDAGSISRDPAQVERYRSDTLISHAVVPAVTGHTLTSVGAALLREAAGLLVPTLVLHGAADGVADPAGSRRLAAAAPAGVVELLELPGGFHELFHDDDASGVPQRATEAVLGFLARCQQDMSQPGSTRISTNFR